MLERLKNGAEFMFLEKNEKGVHVSLYYTNFSNGILTHKSSSIFTKDFFDEKYLDLSTHIENSNKWFITEKNIEVFFDEFCSKAVAISDDLKIDFEIYDEIKKKTIEPYTEDKVYGYVY